MSLLAFASIVPYLVPTVVAAYRDHPAKTGIFLLNLFLGWTIIGWIVALVWAVSGPRAVQPVATAGDIQGRRGLKLQGGDPRLEA